MKNKLQGSAPSHERGLYDAGCKNRGVVPQTSATARDDQCGHGACAGAITGCCLMCVWCGPGVQGVTTPGECRQTCPSTLQLFPVTCVVSLPFPVSLSCPLRRCEDRPLTQKNYCQVCCLPGVPESWCGMHNSAPLTALSPPLSRSLSALPQAWMLTLFPSCE